MESQPQNPEFRINPENFHPWNKIFITEVISSCTQSLWVILYAFLSSAAILKTNWQKNISEILLVLVWIQMGPDILSDLIGIKNVCTCCQQATIVIVVTCKILFF